MSIARKIAHKPKGQRRCQEDRRPCHRQPALGPKGRRDQAKGNLKQAGAKIKDAFRR